MIQLVDNLLLLSIIDDQLPIPIIINYQSMIIIYSSTPCSSELSRILIIDDNCVANSRIATYLVCRILYQDWDYTHWIFLIGLYTLCILGHGDPFINSMDV